MNEISSYPLNYYEKIFVLPEDCPEFTPTLLDAIAYRMIDNLVAVSDDDAPMRPFRGCNDFVASVPFIYEIIRKR